MHDFISQSFLENTLSSYLWFLSILLFGLVVKRFFSSFLSKNLYRLFKHNSVPIAELVRLVRKPIETFFLLLMGYLAFDRLHLPTAWGFAPAHVFGFRMVVFKLYESLVISSIAWLLIQIVQFLAIVFQENARQKNSRLPEQFMPFFRDLGIMTILILTIFVLLGRVFEVNVPALVTGLGIGGLAIALAARETLENLFASFSIMLDMPFAINDTIQMGTLHGEVEKIGFRTTHIRLKDGSLATIPNRLITSQTIENQTQRPYWRSMFVLYLHEATPINTLQQAIADINLLIEHHPKIFQAIPGKTHLEGISQDALLVKVWYHVATQRLETFRLYQEEINWEILKILQKHQIQFAMPSQKIWIEKP